MQPLFQSNPDLPATVSGADMLVRIAAELDRLAEHGTMLQATVSAAMAEPGLTGVRDTFQSLDLMTQTLEALAFIVNTLQRTTPANWSLDVDTLSHGIGLHSLYLRLLGDDPVPHPAGTVDIW